MKSIQCLAFAGLIPLLFSGCPMEDRVSQLEYDMYDEEGKVEGVINVATRNTKAIVRIKEAQESLDTLESQRARRDSLGGGPLANYPVVRAPVTGPDEARPMFVPGTQDGEPVYIQFSVQQPREDGYVQPQRPSAGSSAPPMPPSAQSQGGLSEEDRRVLDELKEARERQARKELLQEAFEEVLQEKMAGMASQFGLAADDLKALMQGQHQQLRQDISQQTQQLQKYTKEQLEAFQEAFESTLKTLAAKDGYKVVKIYNSLPSVVGRTYAYEQHVIPGGYYRVWKHPPTGCVYYKYYPYHWYP